MTDKYEVTANWKQSYGLVAMLDLLGTSSLDDERLKESIVKLIGLEQPLGSIEREVTLEQNKFGIEVPFRRSSYVFGDSLALVWDCFSRDRTDLLFAYLARFVGETFCNGLINGLLLRGCMAMGKYYDVEGRFVGVAAKDAAEWYEAANWAGIMLTPSTTWYIEGLILGQETERGRAFLEMLFPKYKVPSKRIECSHSRALNWPFFWRAKGESENVITAQGCRQHLFMKLTDPLALSGDPAKVFNALEFYDWCHEHAQVEEQLEIFRNPIARGV